MFVENQIVGGGDCALCTYYELCILYCVLCIVYCVLELCLAGTKALKLEATIK